MVKVNELLARRFKKASEKLSKMTGLAELSSSGSLSSFSGIFRVSALLPAEQELLRTLLSSFNDSKQEIEIDLETLMAITSEVKAINNQAAILHGERIKRAQEILKKYRDGAFSAWLMQVYGNRQTPYNFLQYYELYTSLPDNLQSKVDEMPRQAVYTLASRSGSLEQKEAIVQKYSGQSKQELLTLIRETFPLAEDDKRAEDLAELTILQLRRIQMHMKRRRFKPTDGQREELHQLLSTLQKMVK